MALTDGTFEKLKTLVKDQFDDMVAASDGKLFVVNYDRDVIWEAYLNTFPEAERQEHRCNCCKAFIRQVGGAVIINSDLSVTTVWNVTGVPALYAASVKALANYVSAQPIVGLYFHENEQAGTDKNLDKVRNVIWQHFHVRIPCIMQEDKGGTRSKASAKVRETASMLKRALEEFALSDLDTVLELIDQNSLYRGAEFRHIVQGFRDVFVVAEALVTTNKLPNFYWAQACKLPEQVARIRNVSIGQLLIDLAAGDDLEKAVGSFERMVGGANYKRPTAIATPRMIEDAKKKLEELGFISALHRRQLNSRDLSAANALFTYRPTSTTKDVFAELAGDAPVDVKTLSKVEEVSVLNFVEKLLPTTKSLRVLLERPHLDRLVTLTGTTDPDATNLFAWDNSFGWSYTGGVADSIKERVKTAGGKVDGWMRASLGWHNHDDLDLHLTDQTGRHVYYGHKRSTQLNATLDVDMNCGTGTTRTPVENIDIARQLPAGEYVLKVNNYSARDHSDKGFDLEVEVNGATATFASNTSPRDGQSELLTFKVDKTGEVTFAANAKLSSASSSAEKWGLKTGQWHTVGAVTFSPNYWTRPTTNRHLFFLLKGCRVTVDEKVRPFYNEFLCGALTPHRKVTEMLAGKIDVTPADGEELSGIGFSMTHHSTDDKPAHVYVEIESNFKRVVKVVF